MKRRDPVIVSAQSYFGPCHNLNDFFKKKDGYEIFYNLPDHFKNLSKGFVYLLKCQPGLILSIARHYPSTAFSISFEEETSCISLFFILGDDSHISHIQCHNQEQEITFCTNQGYLTYSRNFKSGLIHCPATPFSTIGISIEPWFIKRFSQGIAEELTRKIEEMLALQNKERFFCFPVSMAPSINVRLHEILGCTYIDARRPLFLGSKALELIICGFDQFNSDKGQAIPCFEHLATGSRNFVHKARDIIISDIKKPPSLTELSRMVGVNRTTLTKCFSKVYGVTIFNFLRTFRLEESRRLLQGGNRSVTQVAFEVGYSHQKTFSREFKKYFGHTPSDYLG
jgi:AraC-like DNA-binding protein